MLRRAILDGSRFRWTSALIARRPQRLPGLAFAINDCPRRIAKVTEMNFVLISAFHHPMLSKTTGTLVLFSLLAALPLFGQDAGGLEIAQVSGKLEAIAGYQIKLKSEEGKEIFAIINPQKTNFTYAGTAESKFLMPGLFIRFTALFDQSGQAQSALEELEIFTPVQKRRMTNEFMRDQTPGIYPLPEKDEVAAPTADVLRCRIVGKIAAIQADHLQIAAGSRPLLVQLAPDVVIKVSAGDTTFCREGDQVEVSGLRNAAQENYVQAETITITGATPLAPIEQKTRGLRNQRDKGAQTEPKLKPGDKPALNRRK